MLKKLFLIIFLLSNSLFSFADEGMWLPSQIAQRIADMQSKGFKLTAEDIYSINNSSLKDAIVHFNGGCTGEIISDEGLLITNHHCGYSQIQSHSSVEHDYLKDGFWAMTRAEELPNKNLYVAFLEYMDDVTDRVLEGYNPEMTEEQREELVMKNSAVLKKEAESKGKGLKARVAPLYYGNQYFIWVYKVFTDVRLVGAPPSSIGKFGGDTDNWMWPRHTGDFSMFRIYAGKDNEPAAYSPENVPYKPKRSFKINASGIKEGDFTLVYGFPGRTNEYLMSDAVKFTAELSNPHKIKLRTLRLDIQNREMAKSQAVRIQYSSKNASVSNAWKKWQGEMKGIYKMNTIEEKQNFESRFTEWAKGKPEYEGIIEKFSALYAALEPLAFVADYQKEAINAVELLTYAATPASKRDSAAFYKDYYQPIDKDIFIALFKEYDKSVADEYKSPYFKETLAKMGSVEAWADAVYGGGLDLAAEVYMETNSHFNKNIKPIMDSLNYELALLYRTYMRGQMEYNKANRGTRVFYPDANSTLRVAYGSVKGYSPSDAVYFTPVSSLEGIMQKDNPDIFDYNIPQKLRDIYAAKDYGVWEVDGSVPVAFIATNHTSGGNSGSPVLDANGNLIGVNFDRVWEGTMSDVVFDPEVCRNIALDIRYALFIVDKLAGAQHLLDEMDIIR
ncbi:MAG: S46 family peptidase [Bacteroidales bacterium]|nr:S46 family peptidase [Bacteroidales bacterium]